MHPRPRLSLPFREHRAHPASCFVTSTAPGRPIGELPTIDPTLLPLPPQAGEKEKKKDSYRVVISADEIPKRTHPPPDNDGRIESREIPEADGLCHCQ